MARAVNMALARVQEAKKLGFTRCIVPQVCMEQLKEVKGIELVGVRSIQDIIGKNRLL